jgi:hypothetical protein
MRRPTRVVERAARPDDAKEAPADRNGDVGQRVRARHRPKGGEFCGLLRALYRDGRPSYRHALAGVTPDMPLGFVTRFYWCGRIRSTTNSPIAGILSQTFWQRDLAMRRVPRLFRQQKFYLQALKETGATDSNPRPPA